MPMKQRQLPKWQIVIRDLKRGPVKVVYKDRIDLISRYMTLSNALIPDRHMAESNPNNPTKPDDIKAWDVERLLWTTFKISELEEYDAISGDIPNGNEEGKETRGDTERPGHREAEGVQGTQEAKTDDRGTEGQGERESGEGTGRTWSSKEQ